MKINVTKAFSLIGKDGTKKDFEAGIHEVDKDVAAHWYVQAHSEPVEDEKPAKKSKDGEKSE
ncbi:hypothetical protein ACDA63_07210 [Uliginosibacterium sp. sgz301328]|uniref:STY1053 family phage-associated protein n=1 Tax=Uliginosibacterium sp. sgz301328 TaxID=3243764 RepID=UPI00359E6056